MNYPVWLLEKLGGGSLIAIVAILHVYISHLAVGGGLFLFLTDWRAYRRKDEDLEAFLHRYNWVFLLVTAIFGAVTGVGIWFTISLVSPAATSGLIHTFVFGWAIEWVFFIAEVTSLLIYNRYFKTLNRKARVWIAFYYALFAWLSLVVINGILSFMLTPGAWLTHETFWNGFFNPSFLPSMLFRTFAAVLFAGLFAFLVGSFQKRESERRKVMLIGVRWLIVAAVGLVLTGTWYFHSVPSPVRYVAFILNPEMHPYQTLFWFVSPVIFVLGLFFILKAPRGIQKGVAFLLAILGLLWIGGFEYAREISRKPFVIRDYIYSTSIFRTEVPGLDSTGVLTNAKWTKVHSITDANRLEAGRELMNIQCLPCHTMGGRNDLIARTADYPYMGMMAMLTGFGKARPFMPPFVGTPEEKDALARYIVTGLHGKKIVTEPSVYKPPTTAPPEMPNYDVKKTGYVLLAWNDLGMHCISDSDPWFVILPPANTLQAQLVKRGAKPAIVTRGITVTYSAPEAYRHPSKHVKFWKYAPQNFGEDIPDGLGLAGNGTSGKMVVAEDGKSFIAKFIPVVPYPDDQPYDPYPLFTVEAHDSATGNLLAVTKAVLPTSTEMGCRNCHGGGWRVQDAAGVSDETAKNILAAHDRISGTNLLAEAEKGKPHLCQYCHGDPALGVPDNPNHRSLSAAMHGWHAVFVYKHGAEACALCHPAYPKGYTRCMRGIHNTVGLNCVNCHGTLEEHALSLLKIHLGKPGTAQMIERLSTTHVPERIDVNARLPWEQEPDCLTCHKGYDKPAEGASAFNTWVVAARDLYRNRTDHTGMKCEACHGSTHAEYPAFNPYDRNRDNVQPLQYQGTPYTIGANRSCTLCHTDRVKATVHHPNIYRDVRNEVEWK